MPDLRRSAIASGLALALATGLVACGANSEDTDSAADATPSVSSSPVPSPSRLYEPATRKHPARNVPDPGPLPKVAKEKNKVGQLAFAEHWFKEVNYAWQTGGFRDEFWEITSRECEYCQAAEKTFARMKKDNAWIVGGYNHFENIHAPNKKLDDGTYYVTFTAYEEERVFFRPGESAAVETTAAGSTDAGTLILERKNDGWEVQGVYGAGR